MPKKDLHILVISYYFPPFQRVGGRRWAKHCKYLNRMGVNMQVLAGDFINSTSAWDDDIKEYQDLVTRVQLNRSNVPYFKKTLPQNFLNKLKWKLSLWLWNIKKIYLKGNYSDASVHVADDFYKAARKIITTKSINTVLLSVGPFRYSEALNSLKNEFPHLKYIIDYRDYWEDGLNQLTQKQINYEKELQIKVVQSSDLIIVPNMEMKSHYELKFSKNTYCLPHCFDEEDIKNKQVDLSDSENIKLIYGGAFYNDIHDNIELIKKTVDTLSQKNKVEVEFYVSIKGYEKELTHPLIKRFDFIDTEQYFTKIQKSNYVILILPPNRVNAMSSKFFELVALRKPILYFGAKGEVSEYLVIYRLGYHITLENMNTIINDIYNNATTQQVPDKNYDVSSHTFKYQTKLLIDKLEEL